MELKEKFWDAMYWLEDKGIPAFKVADPLDEAWSSAEQNGLPMQTVAAAILVVGIALVVYAALPAPKAELRVSVQLDTIVAGEFPVEGVSVLVEWEGGSAEKTTRSAGIAVFEVPKGSDADVTASKKGCEDAEASVAMLDDYHMEMRMKCEG